MEIIHKNGKHFLVGSARAVGRILAKASQAHVFVDLGWSLSKQADEASILNGEKYACKDCNYNGGETSFIGGSCPECGNINIMNI